MPENSVTLSFTAPNTHKRYADQITELVNSDLLAERAAEQIYEVEKRQHTYTFSFTDIDNAKIEGFFTALNAFDAKNAMLSCWFEQVGETEYYAMVRGRLLHFDSLDDYKDAIAEKSASGKAGSPSGEALAVDFGRPGREDTLLVRLKAKGKKRQKAILDLFVPLQAGITDDGLNAFRAALSTIKNRDGDKSLRCEEGTIAFHGFTDEWYEGPEHLMKAFVSIHTVGDYLYLGFDMRRIGWEAPAGSPSRKERTLWKRQDSLENLINALGPVFFLSEKSWAKYRPEADKEIYAFLFSDESRSTSRPATTDDEWNLPG